MGSSFQEKNSRLFQKDGRNFQNLYDMSHWYGQFRELWGMIVQGVRRD